MSQPQKQQNEEGAATAANTQEKKFNPTRNPSQSGPYRHHGPQGRTPYMQLHKNQNNNLVNKISNYLGIENKELVEFGLNLFTYIIAIFLALQIYDYVTHRKCGYYKDMLAKIVRFQASLQNAK
ncbi:hypothetical protein C923_01700 [Plasmodium falciparum UGT5.1]|uniref:Small exported membrane protein 1 n=1 Tax=Plasmodium falciparum UGT5.1 TaxID=1237627 RepID=W7JRY5_PLAFA|nr:hypothetical protein C923_01700 [Plasmodium falciparum UGT5.1]